MQNSPGITIRALAERCGISAATTSRALSGHPNVSAKVRARVQAMARTCGYHRNQLVSGLMSQVRAARTDHFIGNLAIVHVPSREQPELLPMQQRIISGAEQRARDLGFHLSVFTLREGEKAAATLARVFRARGIIGVIFLQSGANQTSAVFPSADFAVVQVDHDSPLPLQHTISLDHHLTLIGALTRLHGLGYRQIGLFIERHKDDRLMNKWSAAFRSFQENQSGIGHVPVLKVDKLDRATFMTWCELHSPDLVVGHVDQVLPWLKRAGRDIPEQMGFFNLNWNERTHPCAGLELRPEMHGSVAVETLAAQAQRSERGLPVDPRTVMFNGLWVDGPTVRQANADQSS